MKKALGFLISIYQVFISPFLHAATGTVHACRYPVTCSEYTKRSIEKYGVMKGSALGIRRLLSCNPFAKVAPHQV